MMFILLDSIIRQPALLAVDVCYQSPAREPKSPSTARHPVHLHAQPLGLAVVIATRGYNFPE